MTRIRRTWMMRHSFDMLVGYTLLVLALMIVGHALQTP